MISKEIDRYSEKKKKWEGKEMQKTESEDRWRRQNQKTDAERKWKKEYSVPKKEESGRERPTNKPFAKDIV
jgi:hypothetical protein